MPALFQVEQGEKPMKSEDQIKVRQEEILAELDKESTPLNYIYGLAQLLVLKWVLEEERH